STTPKLFGRQINFKRRTFSGHTCRGDVTVMILYNFLAECQPNTGPGKCCFFVQPLKNGKYLCSVLLIEANSVVTEDQFQITLVRRKLGFVNDLIIIDYACADLDFRPLDTELQRVSD